MIDTHARLTAQDLTDRTPTLAEDVMIASADDRTEAEGQARTLRMLLIRRGLTPAYGIYIAAWKPGVGFGIYVGLTDQPRAH